MNIGPEKLKAICIAIQGHRIRNRGKAFSTPNVTVVSDSFRYWQAGLNRKGMLGCKNGKAGEPSKENEYPQEKWPE